MLRSVLLSVTATPSSPPNPSREHSSPLSANGFILGEDEDGDSLIVTSTSWLTELMDIKLSDRGQMSWRFCDDSLPQFTVLMQTLDGSVNNLLYHEIVS